MANVTPSGLLQLFSGEVLAQFNQSNKLLAATKSKTVGGGALSWQFPVINVGVGKYFTSGDNLITTSGYADANDSMRGTAKTIYADKMLTASAMVNNLEKVLEAFDSRGDYSRQLGAALGTIMDQNIMNVLTQATTTNRAGTAIGFGTASTDNIQQDTADTDGAALVASLYDAQARLSARSVPEEDRFCAIHPLQAKLLFANATAVSGGLEWGNSFFSPAAATGRIPMIAGFQMIVTNSIRSAFTTGTINQQGSIGLGTNTNDYSVATDPWSGSTLSVPELMAVCFHSGAVGTVKVQDLVVETEKKLEYLASLVVASLAVGHGVLRPDAAIAIAAA